MKKNNEHDKEVEMLVSEFDEFLDALSVSLEASEKIDEYLNEFEELTSFYDGKMKRPDFMAGLVRKTLSRQPKAEYTCLGMTCTGYIAALEGVTLDNDVTHEHLKAFYELGVANAKNPTECHADLFEKHKKQFPAVADYKDIYCAVDIYMELLADRGLK